MGAIKRCLEDLSAKLGHGGKINDAVLAAADDLHWLARYAEARKAGTAATVPPLYRLDRSTYLRTEGQNGEDN